MILQIKYNLAFSSCLGLVVSKYTEWLMKQPIILINNTVSKPTESSDFKKYFGLFLMFNPN